MAPRRRRCLANAASANARRRHKRLTLPLSSTKRQPPTGEKLAWRTSIVDLMKALNLDSSLTARKELANELKYTGDTNDSATMNVWLHKQIMAKLAANGGKLPADIKTLNFRRANVRREPCLAF